MSLLYALGLGGASPLSESVGVTLPTTNNTNDDQEFKRTGLKRVSSLKLLPSRMVSRAYGAVSHLPLPVAARPLVYGLWSWMFKVKLDEADCDSLTEFRHLTEFFTRSLRPGARRVDDRPHVLASPVDGTVVSLSCDIASRGVLRQVKGIDYHVCDFLGLDSPPATQGAGSPRVDGSDVNPVVGDKGTALFSAVLYLAPGDYHKFHSPTEWEAQHRAHIAGQLLPVNPVVVQVVPSLFCANERVALIGSWAPARPMPHRSPQCQTAGKEAETPTQASCLELCCGGDDEEASPVPSMPRSTRPMFFSYTAVGATNVGSIRINCEPGLVTNTYKHDWACGFSPTDVAAAAGMPLPSLALGRSMSSVDLGKQVGGGSGTSTPSSATSVSARSPTGTPAAPSPVHAPLPSPASFSSDSASPIVLPPRQKHVREYSAPVKFDRGDEVGVFELGSTVVLVFEAPVDFKWTVREGDKIKMGQALGHLPALRCKCAGCAVAPDDAFSPSSPPPTPFRGRATDLDVSRGPRSSSASSSRGHVSGPEDDADSGSSTDADVDGVTGRSIPSSRPIPSIRIPGQGGAGAWPAAAIALA